MKLFVICNILLFFCLAGPAQAADKRLPLDKKISVEKLVLAEEYQADLKQCRKKKRKGALSACVERKKDALATAYEALEQNPRAYFIAKAKQKQDERMLREAGKLSASGRSI